MASPLTSSVEIYTYNTISSTKVEVDKVTLSIQPSQSLIPGNLVTIAFNKDSSLNVVGELAKWQISFTLVTAIPSGGIISVSFP